MAIVNYSLSIKTDTKKGAGTDNDVFITVYGEVDGKEECTEEINLSKKVRGNAFENGAQHDLNFQWEDIGRPTKIRLRLSNAKLAAADWQFRWCKIKRSNNENNDPDINHEVEFGCYQKDCGKWFKRGDSFMFPSNLGVLREVVTGTKNISQDGGFELLALPKDAETEISTVFSETTTNSIEKCVVTKNGQEHTVNVGSEFGFEGGGFSAKASASYGFKYSTLKSISEKRVNEISKTTSTTTTIKIANRGNTVTEYTGKDTPTERMVAGSDAIDRTYAIVYESSIIEITRKRENARENTARKDTINLGRRVCAVLPLTDKSDGSRVYVASNGSEYQVDKLWSFVKR